MTDDKEIGTDIEQSTDTDTTEPSLRDTLVEAFKEHGTDPEGESINRGPRERDESGRFKPKAEEQADVTEKPADKPVSQVEQTEAAIAAPASWSAEGKAQWAALPAAAQKYIADREAEVHRGFTRLDEDRNLGKSMRETLTPYMATINALGATPQQAVQSLLNADHVLRNGNPQQKTQLFSQLAQQFGVDLSAVVQGAPRPDATVAALQKQVSDLQQLINSQQQTARQDAERSVMTQIEQFKADKPHFDTVRPLMAALMESGQATSLQDAYEQAFRAHPTTSQLWLDGEVSKRGSTVVDAAKARVDKAKRAAVSVAGSPGANNNAPRVQHATLRDELAANFQAAGFNV